MITLYAHFQDLVDAYVGPFSSQAEVDEHVAFCRDRGDGATLIGTVTEPPADAFVMSPAEDRAYVPD